MDKRKILTTLTTKKRPRFCIDGGMADTADSKSVIGNNVWVQVPLDAPLGNCIA